MQGRTYLKLVRVRKEERKNIIFNNLELITTCSVFVGLEKNNSTEFET